jgi:diketogulonate reductase-like aldo/keto reductase
MHDKLTRRAALGATCAGAWALAGAALAPSRPAHSASARRNMSTRPIPRTGEPLPMVGFGTWQTFDIGDARADLDQRKEVLATLFEAGGRVIDSSPMYGRAEAAVGRLLTEMGTHDKAFLATKVWTSGAAAGIAQMEQSFQKLQAKTIDLMQVHNLVDWRTHLPTLRAWKKQGRLRYIGLTHYTAPALDELARIIRSEEIDFVQFGYSIASRRAESRLLPVAAERGVAVIVNQPFDSGSLFARVRGKPLPGWADEINCKSWAQVFLKYILGHPAVTCAIPGTARPDHARDNIAAGYAPLPDAALRRRMAADWDKL